MVEPEGEFQESHFSDPDNYEENLLRDRKERLPDIRSGNHRARRDLIVDLIALANSARRLGRPARLLFGINDRGDVVGISASLDIYCNPEEPRSIGREAFMHLIHQLVSTYIGPRPPLCELKPGYYLGKEVAYLLIHPDAPSEPYHMAKRYPPGDYPDTPQGACWIRDGESNYRISHETLMGDSFRFSYAEVPYLLPSMWRQYLTALESEPLFVEAANIRGYQELTALYSHQTLSDVTATFLNGPNQLLVLHGTAGSGKSVFLRRLAKELTDAGLGALDEIQKAEEFRPPPGWIPCYLSLQGAMIQNMQQLVKRLLAAINRYGMFWTSPPERRDQLFCLPRLRWVVIFDGLDEIWSHTGQQSFLGALREFQDHYPMVKVILSTRDMDTVDWKLWPSSVIEGIAPLGRTKIMNYVAAHVSGERFDEIEGLLHREPEFLRLCAHPIYLAAALDELVGGPVDVPEEAVIDTLPQESTPTTLPVVTETDEVDDVPKALPIYEFKLDAPLTAEVQATSEQEAPQDDMAIRVPIVLDRIYRRLWNRERKRRDDAREFSDVLWNRTGKIALDTDGHRPIFPSAYAYELFGDENEVFWLLSLGLLEYHRPLTSLKFNAHLTQVYFASSYLLPWVEHGFLRDAGDALSTASRDFRVRVLEFLEQLSVSGVPADLEI